MNSKHKEPSRTHLAPERAGSQNSNINRRTLLAAGLSMLSVPAFAQRKPTFRRVRTQYIAALGEPSARSGDNAQTWGWWYKDPGPRGVWLHRYDDLVAAGGRAPAQWTFDAKDWWVDENGLLMEKPTFSIRPGKFVVTGNREAVSILTIHPKDADGHMRWQLDDEITLHDVTHLRCRAARYTTEKNDGSCTPNAVQSSLFPIKVGQDMPDVAGCSKKDYTVLFVIGVATTNT